MKLKNNYISRLKSINNRTKDINGLFILGDFKYFITYDEFDYFGLITKFIHTYIDVLDKYKINNHKMCIVEGYYDKNIVVLINNNQITNVINSDHLFVPAALSDKEKAASFLLRKLNVSKIYTLDNNCKRLAKLLKRANYGDWMSDSIGDMSTIDNGSMTNFSNYMYHAPLGLMFPDFQNNYINTKNKKYGPNIDRRWTFISPNDHPEWLLRDMT